MFCISKFDSSCRIFRAHRNYRTIRTVLPDAENQTNSTTTYYHGNAITTTNIIPLARAIQSIDH